MTKQKRKMVQLHLFSVSHFCSRENFIFATHSRVENFLDQQLPKVWNSKTLKMHNAHPHALNNNHPEATFALGIEANLSERCENKICPGTLKERNLLKQKRKIVKFWRSFFSFVFKSVLFWYHIIITSFWFRDPLKQAADQRSITFSWFFNFCFVLDSSRAFGGNRECPQGWKLNCCPKVSFQENCLFFNITISLAPSVSTFQNILATKCEYFLRYYWLQVWIFFTILFAPSMNIFYDIIGSQCGYFFMYKYQSVTFLVSKPVSKLKCHSVISTTWASFYDITWSKCGYFSYMYKYNLV